MKVVGLKVKPVNFKTLLSCNIGKNINDHFTASITGYVSEEEADKVLKNGQNANISISAVMEDNTEVLLFQGMRTNVTIRYDGDTQVLTVCAVSLTALLDGRSWIRTFQGMNQTYRNIVDETLKNSQRTGIIYTAGKTEKPGRIVVQYNESDWIFYKRLAKELGTVIVADCNNTFPCFYFGMPERKKLKEVSYTDIQIRQVADMGSVKEEQILISREYLELCDVVRIGERNWRVYGVIMTLDKGETIFQYSLELETYKRISCQPENYNVRGVSIFGKVNEVKNGLVRVSLQCDLDQDWGNGFWYDYATIYSAPDGTGWYCMPEPGEDIRLYFPDAAEAHSYVISGVHREDDVSREDPDNKSFKTKHGKEIRFEPDEIVLTNNKGLSIRLNDRKGIFINSNSGISIKSDAFVDIRSGSKISIHAKEGVSLQQNRNMLLVKDGIHEMGRNVEHR
ncbi:contractile injection system protein, VgrG/Pvc8 family [Clostridium boliviensis]|uniref:Contractile injection system protein, VgrG/Pvc8 family n=1 Tax=Clostridium boliviensis TaxID=318465 RepID=A0ABU4GKZ0_9CLOT|nr:contractile injection system protein, VgrG/Pvc8 family [Clostridium boliviensis]MDW2798281.1 contractile injection system protein, VgrG/Pvc8 family [Clostridium boliviensis]